MDEGVEETLTRELRDVAEGVRIPPMPALPQEPQVRRPSRRHWSPLLVAAAVVLIVSGAVAVGETFRGSGEREPAPPASRTEEPVTEIPTTAPSIPYVLDQRLYVGANRVPGAWWSVQSGRSGWLAQRSDNTWWWGKGRIATEISGLGDAPPVISPDGGYVAMVVTEKGRSVVTGFATRAGGQGMGALPVYPGNAEAGDPVRVRAVTNEGQVIVQGTGTYLMWLPGGDNSTVDLTSTAPGQQILGSTPAGLVVNDGADGVTDGTTGAPYLAEISDAGELTRIGSLPTHDDLVVSPDASRLVLTPSGSTGGEVTSIAELGVQAVDGTQQATLAAPAGWRFRVRAWAWEDDDYLVSPVVRNDGGEERMARCGVRPARCVLIATR